MPKRAIPVTMNATDKERKSTLLLNFFLEGENLILSEVPGRDEAKGFFALNMFSVNSKDVFGKYFFCIMRGYNLPACLAEPAS